MSREQKTLSFRVKATGTTTNAAGQEFGQIEAYGAVFNNIDDGNDKILPDSFKRTIKNSKDRAQSREKKYLIPMLWQHDPNELMGGWYDLKEDNYGLLCKGDIALGTQRGREYYELAKAGMADQFSIVYDIPQGGAKYDKSGVRELTELRLFSVDPVTFAMNDSTSLVGVKSDAKGKKKPMDPKQRKTLLEHYQEEMAEDLLEDWQDVYICSLTSAVLDAFTIGDTPETDISEALDAFKELVMSKFVAQAVEVNLSGYLEGNQISYSPDASTLHNGGSSGDHILGIGYMASSRRMLRKAGRSISAANRDVIQGHVNTLNDIADEHVKSARAHAKEVRTVADDLATVIQGSEPAYGTDPGNADGEQEGKSAPILKLSRAPQHPSSQSGDTVTDDELSDGLSQLRLLRKQ